MDEPTPKPESPAKAYSAHSSTTKAATVMPSSEAASSPDKKEASLESALFPPSPGKKEAIVEAPGEHVQAPPSPAAGKAVVENPIEDSMDVQTSPSKESHDAFPPGTFVWSKLRSYPWWPSRVMTEDDLSPVVMFEKKANYVPVMFCQSHDYGWFAPDQLKPYQENRAVYGKGKAKKLRDAMNEADDPAAFDEMLREMEAARNAVATPKPKATRRKSSAGDGVTSSRKKSKKVEEEDEEDEEHESTATGKAKKKKSTPALSSNKRKKRAASEEDEADVETPAPKKRVRKARATPKAETADDEADDEPITDRRRRSRKSFPETEEDVETPQKNKPLKQLLRIRARLQAFIKDVQAHATTPVTDTAFEAVIVKLKELEGFPLTLDLLKVACILGLSELCRLSVFAHTVAMHQPSQESKAGKAVKHVARLAIEDDRFGVIPLCNELMQKFKTEFGDSGASATPVPPIADGADVAVPSGSEAPLEPPTTEPSSPVKPASQPAPAVSDPVAVAAVDSVTVDVTPAVIASVPVVAPAVVAPAVQSASEVVAASVGTNAMDVDPTPTVVETKVVEVVQTVPPVEKQIISEAEAQVVAPEVSVDVVPPVVTEETVAMEI
ncbi:hypothetical protein HKX48_005029 [Thoreauomyces humboldtii]|nr:hypothetical protein HKX48_005029 [Thoreauomyces humboldtii]